VKERSQLPRAVADYPLFRAVYQKLANWSLSIAACYSHRRYAIPVREASLARRHSLFKARAKDDLQRHPPFEMKLACISLSKSSFISHSMV